MVVSDHTGAVLRTKDLFIFRSSWDLPCLFTTTVFNSCEMIDVGHCLEISKSPEFPLSLFIVLLFTNQSSKTNSLKLWKQIFLQITFYKHSANCLSWLTYSYIMLIDTREQQISLRMCILLALQKSWPYKLFRFLLNRAVSSLSP